MGGVKGDRMKLGSGFLKNAVCALALVTLPAEFSHIGMDPLPVELVGNLKMGG